MMHETSKDVAAEQAFLGRMNAEHAGRYQWRKAAGEAPPLDFEVLKGDRVVGVAEYKRRGFKWGAYDTVMVDVAKLLAMHSAHQRDLKAALIVEADDGVYTHAYDPEHLRRMRIDRGGPATSRDAFDVDVVVHIPIELFTRQPQ